MITRLFFLMIALWLLASTARAGGFTNEQRTLFDHIVSSGVTGFEDDRGHIDSMLDGLGTAYTHSGYDRDPGSAQVQKRLRAQATGLEEEITKVETLVSQHGAESNNPAVMLLLLSREQSLGFRIYRWVRSVTELIDLAAASSHHEDPLAAKLCTAMIEAEEARQESLSTAIQGLTGVIGSPTTP